MNLIQYTEVGVIVWFPTQTMFNLQPTYCSDATVDSNFIWRMTGPLAYGITGGQDHDEVVVSCHFHMYETGTNWRTDDNKNSDKRS